MEHSNQIRKNIPFSQHLMEPSKKLITNSVQSKLPQIQKNFSNHLCLIGSPWNKIRIQQQCYLQKAYKPMETEQSTTEPPLGKGKNKEIKVFLEFNKNEDTTYPNLWNTMKAVLRGKFIALSAHIKKMEKAHIRDLIAQLKALEKKEADSPRRSRKLEIIKLRAEINKIETQKTIQRINETKSCFFEKMNRLDTHTYTK